MGDPLRVHQIHGPGRSGPGGRERKGFLDPMGRYQSESVGQAGRDAEERTGGYGRRAEAEEAIEGTDGEG